MLGEFYERSGGRTDGDGGEWIDVCRLERSGMHRNGWLLGDNECG